MPMSTAERSRLANIAWRIKARDARFDRYIEEITGEGCEEVMADALRERGYAVTGPVGEHEGPATTQPSSR